MTDEAPAAGRTLKAETVTLAVRVHPALRDAVKSYYGWLVREGREAGDGPPAEGEMKGYSYALNRVLCWLMSLPDEDQRRIQGWGDAAFRELRELPRNHRGTLPIRQRQASVFPAGGSGAVGPGGRVPDVKGLGGHLHRRPDGGQGPDPLAVPDDAPKGRGRRG